MKHLLVSALLALASPAAALEIANPIDGIPAAVASCPAPSPFSGERPCVVRLPCDTTFDISSHDWTTNPHYVNVARDHITFEGCGDSSVIHYRGNTGNTQGRVFGIWGRHVTLRNFKIVWHETCTAGCGATGGAESLVYIRGPAEHVTLENMTLESHEIEADPIPRGIHLVFVTSTAPRGVGGIVPKNITVRDSYLYPSWRGLETLACDSCRIHGNTVDMAGISGNVQFWRFGMILYGYGGLVTVNSFINLVVDGSAGPKTVGLNFKGTPPWRPIWNVVVTGNQFTGLRSGWGWGIGTAGTYGTTITGNTFEAGECSATRTQFCSLDMDCPTGETCEPTASVAVFFGPETEGNIVCNNTFGHEEGGFSGAAMGASSDANHNIICHNVLFQGPLAFPSILWGNRDGQHLHENVIINRNHLTK
jgi:hypothetical protein